MEAAGSEHREDSNKGPRDRHMAGRLGIQPSRLWGTVARNTGGRICCPFLSVKGKAPVRNTFPAPDLNWSVPALVLLAREASSGRKRFRLKKTDQYCRAQVKGS